MSELGGFRPITDLCQFEMTDEERSLCNQTVEDWTGKLKGYCFTIQQADPADQFCMTALPPPSPNVRTQNILGERARTGRLMVIPQLPVDHDDLPEILQDEDAFDEDAYTAIMENEPPPGPEADDGRRPWIIELFGSFDFGGIVAPLHADGGDSSPLDHGEVTRFAVHVGGGADFGYRFDVSEPVDLFVSVGGEYFLNYSTNGGNLHTYAGRLRFGLETGISDSCDFEVALIAKLGYTESDGPVYHPDTGETELSYLNGAAGGTFGWIWHGELWRVGLAIEGLYDFMQDEVDGISIGPFPIMFILALRTGWNL